MPKRIVSTDFWLDRKVMDIFSPEDRLFMLYLLTNPHSTQLGIYHLPPKMAAFEIGWTLDSVMVLLDRFENKYGIIKWNDETQEVAIKNYLRYSVVKGGKPVYDQLTKEIRLVKDKQLINYAFEHIANQEHIVETVKIIVHNWLTDNNQSWLKKNTNNIYIVKDNDNASANANVNVNVNAISYPDTLNDTCHDTLDDIKIEEILALYQNNIHPFTGIIEKEQLEAIIKDFGCANTKEAIKRAVKNNGRSVRYIEKVAEGLANGIDFASKKQKPQSNVPECQYQRFVDIVNMNIPESEWTDIENKIFGRVDYHAFKMRRIGEEQKWVDILCREYEKLGD